MESRNKESNSTEKSEERMSYRLTSVEAEKGQGTSGEAEIAKNSAQGTKRKREMQFLRQDLSLYSYSWYNEQRSKLRAPNTKPTLRKEASQERIPRLPW